VTGDFGVRGGIKTIVTARHKGPIDPIPVP
jgi:hypothetical protein